MSAPGPARRRQRGAGRARPTVQRASLPLPLPVQPSAAEVAALLRSLIKHLLFQRAQIPYLYDELLRSMHAQQQAEAEAEAAAAADAAAGGGRRRRRRRSPKSDKRLLKVGRKRTEPGSWCSLCVLQHPTPPPCLDIASTQLGGAVPAGLLPVPLCQLPRMPVAHHPPAVPVQGGGAAGLH